MHTEDDILYKACFDLSATLMWESDSLTTQKVEAHIKELNETTGIFVQIAESLLDLLHGLDDPQQRLVAAIIYLKDSHAIPPLRGNYDWFKDSLMTLIEIMNPQNSIRKSNFIFIEYIQQGVLELAKMVRDDEDLDQFSRT